MISFSENSAWPWCRFWPAAWLLVRQSLWWFCGTFSPTPLSCRCRRNPTGCRRCHGQTGSPRFRSSSGMRSCDVTWTPRWCSWSRPGRGGSPAAAPPPQRKHQQPPTLPTGTRSLWTTAPRWRWARCQTWKINNGDYTTGGDVYPQGYSSPLLYLNNIYSIIQER